MTDTVTNAEYRAALGSINYNASNYQVFSFSIAFSFLIGLAVIAGTLVVINSEDQALTKSGLYTVVIMDGVILAIVFLAYNSYLTNIGRYIFGRMRPLNFDNTNPCVKSSPSK